LLGYALAKAAPQPSGFQMRRLEGGLFASLAAGRMGRTTSSPPQFGQMPLSFSVTQAAQKVHSKLQMRASGLSGGRSRLQHSQLGRSSNMASSLQTPSKHGVARSTIHAGSTPAMQRLI
jgi:hypothetical protein